MEPKCYWIYGNPIGACKRQGVLGVSPKAGMILKKIDKQSCQASRLVREGGCVSSR